MLKSLSNKQHNELIEFDKKDLKLWEKDKENQKVFDKNQELLRQKEVEKYQNWLQNVLKISNKDTDNKIDFFEKNLSRLGLDITDDKLKKGANKAMMSSQMVIQKIKEKISQNQNAKKERDRRRRKIAVEQGKAQAEIENKKKSNIGSNVVEKNAFSKEKKNSQNLISSLDIVDEKANDERDIIELTFSPKNIYEKEAFLKEVNKQDYRRLAKDIALKKQKRILSNELCKDVADLILDIADDTFQFQLMNKSELIDVKTWKEWMQIFIINEQQIKNEEEVNILNANASNLKLNDKSIHHGLSITNVDSIDIGNE